jgi:ubiquinone/menaquinone biosynthesis C-methylase UbiE
MHYRFSLRAFGLVLVLAFGAAAVHGDAPVQNVQNVQNVQKEDAADIARLVDVLAVRPGSILADIGAGDGVLCIPLARDVGPSGRIYATELGGGPLDNIRKKLAAAAATNIEVVEGDPLRTNLPSACCDGIYIRNVYHHFADPPAMNASLRASLKPGGRLAILDFAPDGPEATTPAARAGGKTHGVYAATVARELNDAGFEPVLTEQRPHKGFLVVARKPSE